MALPPWVIGFARPYAVRRAKKPVKVYWQALSCLSRVLTIVKFMLLLKMRRKKIFSRFRHNKDWFIKRQSICLSSVGGEVNLRLRLQNHWKSCTGAVHSHPWDDTFRLQLSSRTERTRIEKKFHFTFDYLTKNCFFMFVGIKLTKRKAQHTLESDNATQTQIRIGRTMEKNGFHVCELSWIYRDCILT